MEGLEGNFTRPRQVRYQAALRPDICCSPDFKPLSQFPIPSGLPKSPQKPSDRGKTVTKPGQSAIEGRCAGWQRDWGRSSRPREKFRCRSQDESPLLHAPALQGTWSDELRRLAAHWEVNSVLASLAHSTLLCVSSRRI